MKRSLAGLGILLLAAGAALAAPVERYLHVSVVDGEGKDAERVRVNVPLSLAEKVLPAIQTDALRKGRVKLQDCRVDDVDLRAVLEAVRDTKDGEFVTIEKGDEKVRVAKSGGYLLAKVQEGKGGSSKVDVKLPLGFVEALLSGEKDELDLAAAVRALSEHGDTVLVTVNDEKSTIRVWIDSKNESE